MSQTMPNNLYQGRKILIFGVFYLLLSVFALAHFVSSSYLGDRYKHSGYDNMISETASRPFVYRILVPQLTRSITGITPARWRKEINKSVHRWMESPKTIYARLAMPWLVETYHVKHSYSRLVTTLIIYLALLGYALMLYKLGAVLFKNNEAIRWFAPIFGMLAISAFSLPWQYIYDIPTLFLSSACFYFLFTGRMKYYMVFFLLACLNKETAIFNLLFFIIWSYDRIPRSTLIAFSMAQIVIYAGIKVTLTYLYMNNSGFFLEYNLSRVLRLDVFEQAGHYKIVILTMFFFLFTYRWPDKPLFLKRALWIFPLIYVGYFFYGNGGEYRVFFDIKPIMVLLATHTLISAAGFAKIPLFNGSGET